MSLWLKLRRRKRGGREVTVFLLWRRCLWFPGGPVELNKYIAQMLNILLLRRKWYSRPVMCLFAVNSRSKFENVKWLVQIKSHKRREVVESMPSSGDKLETGK